MRERAHSIREWGHRFVPRGKVMGPFVRRHDAALILYGLGAVLMAHVGAFHTAETAPWVRYPYFLSLNLAGGLFGSLAFQRMTSRKSFRGRRVAQAGALVLALTLVLTPLVWILAASVLHGSLRVTRVLQLVPQVAPVATVFVLLQFFLQRPMVLPESMAAPEIDAERAFLAKLPDHLRDADLHAIQAEDHYLRLHTDRGSALIMMRLADAIADLRTVNGAQTHRSWWVARNSVVSVSRGRGRAALKLKSGGTAPVSRSYAPQLRRAGWF